MFRTVFLFCFFYCIQVAATVRIVTFHYNLPDLLEIQCRTLNKFMVEDFELIVLNDARDPSVELEIEAVCAKYGVRCVRFQQEWHHPEHHLNDYLRELIEQYPFVRGGPNNPMEGNTCWRHARLLQYALETYGYSHDDIVVLLDGDAFPIRTISLRQMLANHDIIVSLRKSGNIEFFYTPFIAFDPRKLEAPSEFQLHSAVIDGNYHDTGSYSYTYMKTHPEVKIAKIPFMRGDTLAQWPSEKFQESNLESREKDLVNKLLGYYYELHMDGLIFHFKGSSHRYKRPERTRLVYEFLEDILSQERPPLREMRIDPNPVAVHPGDDA